ncbi:hypothetical protein TRFO_21422 [Tritrichomonas foetus]|uniref:DUF3447 domain-containing protein n=1 Tax=Tritrichomonas foetus TaxID=1144522 RepID=A0A1J4KIG4_9EUKA|nr:hypothetical protein TRFO_21422 [Tritrichomonas foetus]|eukprot:OHT09620.1 hypothetical protein TRFO_21422 [Tritrichomonas foetus]
MSNQLNYTQQKFDVLAELQDLFYNITQENAEEVSSFLENKVFIEDSDPFGIEIGYSVLRLASSIVYIKPHLYDILVQILSKFQSYINIADSFCDFDISDEKVYLRSVILISIYLQIKDHIDNIPMFLYHCQPNSIYHLAPEIKTHSNVITRYKYFQEFMEFLNLPIEELYARRNTLHRNDEIYQIIKEDDVNKLQEYISSKNFDINTTIPESYEEFHIMTKWIYLVQYAAYFGAIKCFKFLFMNQSHEFNDTIIEYAVAGGNFDIIHLIETKEEYTSEHLNIAIEFMHDDLLDYIHHNGINFTADNISECIRVSNYKVLLKIYNEVHNEDKNKTSGIFNEYDNIGIFM